MRKIAYLGIDLHARTFTIGEMDGNGRFIGNREFPTSENNIIQALESVDAKHKLLTIEEGPLTYWAAQVAHPCVDQVIPCDPKENTLIYKSPYKKDKIDTRRLCRLLRLGELKQVYHPANDDRAIFKAAARHYIDLRNQLTRLKQKQKAMKNLRSLMNLTKKMMKNTGLRLTGWLWPPKSMIILITCRKPARFCLWQPC